ncbi:MAG: uroporphyrinogen-III C-methyltransferase [Lachnospiraceae bacterium]
MKTGKVWLVGAGPGDAGLFTIKGRDVLEQAEVVVYDSLVGQGILAMIPEHAKAVNVGKRSNNHTMPQEEINQLLVREAQAGAKVVRLKGGDPFLFGRGGEELELLQEAGIPYEVVPGITSPLAVPAYNGIPVTHRDYCSSMHIITGHKRAGASYDIDFEALIKTRGTLVFLMGISALADIQKGLLDAGIAPDMPAAVLQQGTTAGQKRIVSTVADIVRRVQEEGIETPAIIVVGRVCELADKFAWYEKLPLAGYKVVVTRPRQLISRMAHSLREQGAEVIELPAIRTQALLDQSRLQEAIAHIAGYQWIVFTSPTGVRVFFEELNKLRKDVRTLAALKIAVVGEGTRKEVEKYGLLVDFIPSVYDGTHLGAELAAICDPQDHILIPRASLGNEELVEELQKKVQGAIDDIATYETIYYSSDIIDEKDAFENGKVDCAVFTSASTVRGFAEATKGLDYSKVHAACIGRQTQEAADAYGMKTFVAEKATIESVVKLVAEMKQKKD